jgi:hypothetical protein
LEKYPLTIPILSHGIYDLGDIRKTNAAPGEESQGIYFALDIIDISDLKLRAIVSAESAGVVGAAAGQGKKIAFPFTGRSDDIGSTEAHVSIEFDRILDRF